MFDDVTEESPVAIDYEYRLRKMLAARTKKDPASRAAWWLRREILNCVQYLRRQRAERAGLLFW